MKKIISLLLILVMLISFSACKRAPANASDQEIAVAGGESDKVSESKPEEQEQEVQTPTENTEQKDTQTPTESTAQKQEKNDAEAQKPVEQTPTVTLKYPELQALNQQLQKEFGLENKGYPTDVYLQEYLPLKLGHVKKETYENKTSYYKATKNFVTKEPITEQMLEAASKYPYGEREEFHFNNSSLGNIIPSDQSGFLIYNRDDYDSVLSYVEEFIKDDCIVKGYFKQSYGTACVYYNVENRLSSTRCNYKTDEFTIYDFVIEKIYTDNCEYKVGDVIEIAFPGTVMQDVTGFYRATATRGDFSYNNFKNASLEDRTFIISFKPKNEDSKFGNILRLSNIRQNVYQNIPDIDNDDYKLSREILAKYN